MAAVKQVLKIFIVFLIPSLLTIESVETSNLDDDKSWLRYWVVISILSILEMPVDKMQFLPGYTMAKMVLVGWCLLPGPFSGTNIIFKIVSFFLQAYFYLLHYFITDLPSIWEKSTADLD